MVLLRRVMARQMLPPRSQGCLAVADINGMSSCYYLRNNTAHREMLLPDYEQALAAVKTPFINHDDYWEIVSQPTASEAVVARGHGTRHSPSSFLVILDQRFPSDEASGWWSIEN